MQRSFVMNRPRDVEQSWTCVSLRRYRFREEELAITSSAGSRYLVISPCYNYTYHRGAVARLRRSYNKDVRFSPLSSRRHGEAVDEIGASDRENFQPRIFTEGVSTLLPFSVRKTRRRGGKKPGNERGWFERVAEGRQWNRWKWEPVRKWEEHRKRIWSEPGGLQMEIEGRETPRR